jgi:hypothetical protein
MNTQPPAVIANKTEIGTVSHNQASVRVVLWFTFCSSPLRLELRSSGRAVISSALVPWSGHLRRCRSEDWHWLLLKPIAVGASCLHQSHSSPRCLLTNPA